MKQYSIQSLVRYKTGYEEWICMSRAAGIAIPEYLTDYDAAKRIFADVLAAAKSDQYRLVARDVTPWEPVDERSVDLSLYQS